MSECDHVTKVVEFQSKLIDGDVVESVKTWGCTKCAELSDRPFPSVDVFIDHSDCDKNPCFGHKAKGLQLNTGDANHQKSMSNKKWDGELNAYRQARAEGIQPSGTSMKAITEARNASEAMGQAYDGDTMGPAHTITKETAPTLKEIGAI
jgi:hypothetical protein